MKENQKIEWKSSWRDEYLKSISGFANADGGKLSVGVNDDGQPVGLANAQELLEEIPNKIRNILGIIAEVNLRGVSPHEYIEISVEPYTCPISYKGRYYQRSGSTTLELKGAALDKFLLRKQGIRWDSVPVPGVSADDLDKNTLKNFRNWAIRKNRLTEDMTAEEDKILLERLHLVDGKYLKRAAVLLFHPDPEKFVTGAFVKVGFFESESEIRYQDEIHGDLFAQMDKTMDILLTKYLKAKIHYQGIRRLETFPIPEEALREALLNAIAHKDYSSGTPIQIRVYDDKIAIWNCAELYEGWTIETLIGKHISKPFNPDISRVFAYAGMVESWGRGIQRIMDACEKAGGQKPIFSYRGALCVEFPYDSHSAELADPVNRPSSSTQSTDPVAQLVEILRGGELSTSQIMARLGLKHRHTFRENYLRPAMTAGLIEHTIPDKPNSSLQKYRLTK